MIKNIHEIDELAKLREESYGMASHNLNPEDVVDYMAIASAAARMESRKRGLRIQSPEGGWKEPVRCNCDENEECSNCPPK